MNTQIVIIGGGASGLCAAIAVAQTGATVCLLEAGPRVGRKILASGNGRCNLTNMEASPSCYHGDRGFAAGVLDAMPPAKIIDFFAAQGLLTATEAQGRVYPYSGLASSVLDVLRGALDHHGVRVETDCPVSSVRREADGFVLFHGEKNVATTKRLILATGGPASPKLGGIRTGHQLARSLGHTLVPLLPALTPLTADFPALPSLKGIRAHAALSLFINGVLAREECGELLFTEYGLSGVCAMQLARFVSAAAAKGQSATVFLNLLPGLDADALFVARKCRLDALPISSFFTGLFHRRIGELLLRQLPKERMAAPISSLTGEELQRLAQNTSTLEIPLTGTRDFAQAQVTAGGIDTREIDASTMASKVCPGLYCTGELLNVDGDCGGMNLHFAWATGLLAGAAAARREDPC